MPLLILFVIVPLVELYFLISVGEVVGALSTVLLVIFTAVIGGLMVRRQGFQTMLRMRETAARGETPALEMLEGSLLLLSGLMLLLPGFVTDLLGFALLVPPLRSRLVLWALRRGGLFQTHASTHDGEYSHYTHTHREVRDERGRRIIEADEWKKED